MAGDLTVWVAFWGGVVSFVSPCVLPLYPSFLSYVTGVSVREMREGPTSAVRWRIFGHSLAFAFGLSVIYFLLGLGASEIGRLFQDYQRLIGQIGGIVVIAFGLVLLGWLNLDVLNREWRMELKWRPSGLLGSFLIGFVFGAGWTPCIGPVLGAILIMAASQPELAMWYTFFFALGFSLPFVVLGFFIGGTRWIMRYSNALVKIGGVLMIAMGLLLFTGQLNKISAYLTALFGGSWLR